MLAQWTDFSVYARHITPRGPSSADRGIVNGAVVFGGRVIRPGDLLIGDDDGLVALSPEIVRGRIADAEAKLQREAGWEASLAAGHTMAATFGLTEPAGAAPAQTARRRTRPR